MHTRRISVGIISALFAASLAAGARADHGEPANPAALSAPLAQNGSAFTYQGQLRKNGTPVNASCNASFSLFDAATGGAQVGGTVTSPTLQVANGLFTIPLDFGWNFNGEARWLETAIGCGEAQATLAPRTALRPAPYAFALPGMRTVPGDNDPGGNRTINVIGGVVSGAISNTVSANSFNSVIAGGSTNRIDNGSDRSAIGGGQSNSINSNSDLSAIGGGGSNRIDRDSDYGAIGGGRNNRLDNGSDWDAISGGEGNLIDNDSNRGAIGGGHDNRVDNGSDWGAISGGQGNLIDNASDYGAIAGGGSNIITGSNYGAIGGGGNNIITRSDNGAIGGGQTNIITGSDRSAIAGGLSNRIDNESYRSAIAGGESNHIDNQSRWSAIGGGYNNRLDRISYSGAIGGGDSNRIDRNSDYGAIGGGQSNSIDNSSDRSAIGGGGSNIITGSVYGAIGGGESNVIIAANRATIPGGSNNRVEGDYGYAAGRRAMALHNGSFVWGDSADADIASTKTNQFVVRASNGLSMSVTAGPSKAIDIGERYRDNAIVAWGRVTLGGVLDRDFGVVDVTTGTAGVYTITLTAVAVGSSSLIPTASAEVDNPPSGLASMRIVMVNQYATNQFAVYIVNGSGTPVDNDFTFIVTGR